MSDFYKFLASWGWKREGRDEKQRFVEPYKYPWTEEVDLSKPEGRLLIHQDRSNAKTVWDSVSAHLLYNTDVMIIYD